MPGMQQYCQKAEGLRDKAASFRNENWRLWSEWRDSNSRHPGPKQLTELFSNIFRSFLAPFIPEKLLFETLVSTVSMCSKPGYGQICGQKPLPAKSGKRFVHSEDLFKAILPGRLHHLLHTGGERVRMLRTDGAEEKSW